MLNEALRKLIKTLIETGSVIEMKKRIIYNESDVTILLAVGSKNLKLPLRRRAYISENRSSLIQAKVIVNI